MKHFNPKSMSLCAAVVSMAKVGGYNGIRVNKACANYQVSNRTNLHISVAAFENKQNGGQKTCPRRKKIFSVFCVGPNYAHCICNINL